MPLHGKRLAFIGGGTMAEAMIRGLLEKHLVPPSHVLVTGPRRERRADLAKRFGVKALASNVEAAKGAHVVVLSVKPQVLPAVLRELRGQLRPEQLVLSIVAGAPLAVLREGLDHAAVVRAMPNTPAPSRTAPKYIVPLSAPPVHARQTHHQSQRDPHEHAMPTIEASEPDTK